MPGVLEVLDAAAVRRWCETGLRDLLARREEINDLNVYPVPDGDTGTNLVATMESVVEALRAAPAQDLGATVKAIAHGSLMGARGNSGVILSQLLRGLAEVLAPLPAAGPADLQRALERAAELAYAAVAQPVEGTVLTVARAAAEGARAVAGNLMAVMSSAAADAHVALDRTPELLPVLKQAGVVDAGGRGLCVLLDSLLSVVTGEPGLTGESPDLEPPPVVLRDRTGLAAAREAGSDEYAYEVQFLLDADDASVADLRKQLSLLGDSLVLVGGDGLWNVHVHVNDVAAAVEAGIEAGRPHRLSITRFDDQIAADRAQATPAQAQTRSTTAGRAVVAVAPGEGLVELFVAAGATVVSGGPTANPSTREILDAIVATGGAEVVVLPNDGNVLGTAAQAATAATTGGRVVHVVPTRSPVQGLAALAVHDPTRSFADDAIAMTDAARSTRWAEVTTAVRDAQTMAGPCTAGDVLGLVGGEVVVVGDDVADVGIALLERLLASGGELVTVVVGVDGGAELGERVRAAVRASHPVVEVDVHDGRQPHYPLLLGVE
ncbi:MAG TPA: DAK2 domain-containing protein [Mycobacteriales bacterium]|nr:DAK2 domain-containing protein [Mycobacteriales bacterium]